MLQTRVCPSSGGCRKAGETPAHFIPTQSPITGPSHGSGAGACAGCAVALAGNVTAVVAYMRMLKSDFYLYERRLPHWRLRGATYFVTWRLADGQRDLTPEERTLASSALRHFDGQRYELCAFVVMNDHIHTLVTPLPNHQLQDLVHSWKSFTAHALRRGGAGRRPCGRMSISTALCATTRSWPRRLGTS